MSPWIVYARFNEAGARKIAIIQHKIADKTLFIDDAGNNRYFWNEEIGNLHSFNF